MLTVNILKNHLSKIFKVLSTNEIDTLSRRITNSRQNLLLARVISTQKLKPPWSVLFFGTDDFALQSLKELYDEYRHNKLLCRFEVVTAYRGKENSVTRFANHHNITIHNWPPRVNLAEFHIGLVVSFGYLIPGSMINSFPLGMLNVHGSLLPRWRGAAPIIYAIMNGDRETGVSIMKIMPKKFDVGEIVAQRKLDVHPDETMPEVRNRMSRLGAELLLDTVKKLPDILVDAEPQNENGITYAPKVTSKISLVKWSEMTAKNVYDLERALTSLYPLTTKFMGSTVKLFGIRMLEAPPPVKHHKKIPGLVLYSRTINKLVVLCAADSWISIDKIGCPNRPPMSARDFNNGFIAKNQQKETFFIE